MQIGAPNPQKPEHEIRVSTYAGSLGGDVRVDAEPLASSAGGVVR